MGRTRDVSKILTSNTSILTLASASATYATNASMKKIVQVVTATKASSFSSSALDSEQFVYEVAITPTSTANKILLFINTNGIDNGGSGRLNTRIRYNATSGGITGTILLDQMTIANDSTGTNGESGASGTVLTSAIGSTSTQYFKLTATKYDSSTTWFVCRYDAQSTLVAMEITP
jgi:adenine-specific DNA methylase